MGVKYFDLCNNILLNTRINSISKLNLSYNIIKLQIFYFFFFFWVLLDSNVGNSSANVGANNQQENQWTLPISSVLRLMRQVVPKNAKISDDAKEAVRSCVCEYIGIITDESNERCHKEQRKTITSDDLIWAMSSLGFDNYAELLNVYLQRVRHSASSQRVAVQGGRVGLPPSPPRTRVARSGSESGSGSGTGGNVEGESEFDPFAYLNRGKFL